MLPFKRILCPTDFSEPAFVALKRAEELARHFAAELIVAHVIPPLPGPHSFPDPQAAFNSEVPLFQQELAIKAEQMLKDLVSHHKAEDPGPGDHRRGRAGNPPDRPGRSTSTSSSSPPTG